MLYAKAALVIDELEQRAGSLKSLAKKHCPDKDTKRVLALAIQTLKYAPSLKTISAKCSLETLLRTDLKAFTSKSSQGQPNPSPKTLILVLLHDLLFNGRGIVLGKDHPLRKVFEKHATRLRAEKEKLKVALKVKHDQDLQIVQNPSARCADGEQAETASTYRYLRINTIKWTLEEAESWLTTHGYNRLDERPKESDLQGYSVDHHIPDLLIFHKHLKLTDFEPYLSGEMIAQDKASCMPPYILLAGLSEKAKEEVRAIDATAAPGNKTSCLSAILSGSKKSKIVAYERDQARFAILQKLLSKAGCQNVLAKHGDFMRLSAKHLEYQITTHMLVDPSCSGSGMAGDRLDYLTSNSTANSDEDAERITALSNFQVAILSHSLRFPSLQRIVYSTCSIHQEENEKVIARILSKPEFAARWRVADRQEVLPSWARRGVPTEGLGQEQTDGMIRCSAQDDGTHGFFVCLLIRNTAVPWEEGEPEWMGIPSDED